jgi:hypothetical protein
MERVNFTNAYYVKLGRGGKWEESSIEENKLRIGWLSWLLEEINQGTWDSLKKKYQHQYKNKGAATRDIKALQFIVESTSDDIWITFYKSQLYWCGLGKLGIQKDETSNYRILSGIWNNQDIHGNHLLANQIPGSIAKVQRFSGTICKVREVDDLRRLINDERSDAFKDISHIKANLIIEVEKGFKQLHWKDFETLVDLLFRNAGWRRVSLLGESMKFTDMELEEPVTGDKYQVQVKAKANISEFEKYAQSFEGNIFRKLYFVVHSPEKSLALFENDRYKNVVLILPKRLAEMVVGFGLTDWLLTKIK